MAILNDGTKNEKVKADAAIRLMIASELAETADERRAIRHEVVGAIKDVDEGRKIIAETENVKLFNKKRRAEWDVAYKRFCEIIS